jgi:hypothetical protein
LPRRFVLLRRMSLEKHALDMIGCGFRFSGKAMRKPKDPERILNSINPGCAQAHVAIVYDFSTTIFKPLLSIV